MRLNHRAALFKTTHAGLLIIEASHVKQCKVQGQRGPTYCMLTARWKSQEKTQLYNSELYGVGQSKAAVAYWLWAGAKHPFAAVCNTIPKGKQ
jgi:hypothetical protein